MSQVGSYEARLMEGKERKRVQNRLAQRAYRRRRKAEFEALQARVEMHERNDSMAFESDNAMHKGSPSDGHRTAPWTPAASICSREDTEATSHNWSSALGSMNGQESYASFDPTLFEDIFDVNLAHDTSNDTESSITVSPDQGNMLSSGTAELTQTAFSSWLQRDGQSLSANIAEETLSQHRNDHRRQNSNVTTAARTSRSENKGLPSATALSSQDRIRHVMDEAAYAGFDSLDSAIMAYYTEDFDDATLLYEDQRLGRNRRAPRLISTLHNAAKDWSEWERRGLQEQIARCAEEILVSEFDAHKEYGGVETEVRKRRRQVQDSLPNLWALITTLLARRSADGQSYADTALAVIDLICSDKQIAKA